MINSVTLSCFKQHENLHVDFTDGLVALKGANEAGKSTVYAAIRYTLYGIRALQDTLENTVTWGKPEKALKVVLVLTHEGKQYKISRAKSGAELTAEGLTVSGQAEVTRFVERLFGVSADTASKIMVANQSGIKGALEDGSAMQLIEKLANINLVDELVTKVQEQLPSGSVKLLQSALDEIGDLVLPLDPVPDRQYGIDDLQKVLDLQESAVKELQTTLKAQEVLATQAKLQIDADIRLKATLAQLHARHADLNVKCASALPDKPEALELLYEAEAEQAEKLNRAGFYSIWESKPKVVEKPTQTVKELSELAVPATETMYDKSAEISDLRVEVAKLTAMRITETACGLCGKDLQNVPEVVEKNSKLDQQLAVVAAALSVAKVELEDLTALAAKAKEAVKIADLAWRAYDTYFEKLQAWKAKLEGKINTQLEWVGGKVEVVEAPTDFKKLILQRTKELQTYTSAVDKLQVYISERNQVLAALCNIVEPADQTQNLANIAKVAELRDSLTKTQNCVLDTLSELTSAKNCQALAKQQYLHELETFSALQTRKVQLLADMAATVANNGLIKRLREARPIIATKLWSAVLHSVSHYFSAVRGVESTVTRSDSEFLVDGKPASSYSGSTIDSLGLSLRMALSKTFLPSIDWLLLDEPASGMDKEREQSMLGLLASSGYNQVVVSTHSVLADSVANSVVQL